MTASIVQCPHCQAKMRPNKTPEAGQRIRCPRCGEAFRPDHATQTAVTQPPAPAQRPVAAFEPDEEALVEPEDTTEEDQADAAEPEKRRKKKRAKKKKATSPTPNRLPIGLRVLAAVLVCGGLVFMAVKVFSGGDEVIVAKPTIEYVDEGPFRCKYPEGWTVKAFGEKPYRNVTFSSGSAEINIRSNLAVSTLEDAAVTGQPKFLKDPRGAMIDAHESQRSVVADQVGDGYQEEGEVEFMMGIAPRSRFTTRGGWLFGKKMRGYRMTIVVFPQRLNVVCMCKDSDWAKLEPVFAEALASVQSGR